MTADVQSPALVYCRIFPAVVIVVFARATRPLQQIAVYVFSKIIAISICLRATRWNLIETH